MSVKGSSKPKGGVLAVLFLIGLPIMWADEVRSLELEVFDPLKLPKTTDALTGKERQKNKEISSKPDVDLDAWTRYERETQPAAFGPSTARMAYRVKYPDYELAMRNLMDPIPLANNPQLYPFMMSVPFEGGDVLAPKHLELVVNYTHLSGKMEGRSARYQIDMDHELSLQTFGISMGLPKDVEVGVSIPLYHLEGDLFFTQDGIAGIGPLSASRNYWGGATVRVKGKVFKSHNRDKRMDLLMAGYFQFPEGNQRAQGGTTTGHWALNLIMEKRWLRQRFHLNMGVTQPGALRLDNGMELTQDMGWFVGAGLSHKLTPTSAIEVQFHGDRSALEYTGISDLQSPQWTAGLGFRKQLKKSLDASVTAIKGIDAPINAGASVDLRYFW